MKSAIAAKFYKNVSFWRGQIFPVKIIENSRIDMFWHREDVFLLYELPVRNQVDSSPHVVH